ncbi:MAG: AMP-binding protein, partial [Pseudomonadota bacterium]
MTGDAYFAGKKFEARAIADAAARAASGLLALGATGGCVALLLRNDIAFLVAGDAARQAGGITLPVNWHLKADDVAFILEDSGARIVIAHADLWCGVADKLPGPLRASLAEIIVPTPPSTCAAFNIDPEAAKVPTGARDWTTFIKEHDPIDAPVRT